MTKDRQGATNLFIQLIHAEFVGHSSFFDKSLCQESIDLHMKIDESLDNLGKGHELSLQFHPFRLKNWLVLSVFLFEVMGDTGYAVEVAEDALNKALDAFMSKESTTNNYETFLFDDVKAILDCIKENLGLWRDEEYGEECIDC